MLCERFCVTRSVAGRQDVRKRLMLGTAVGVVVACLLGVQAGLTHEDPDAVCGPPKRGEHCGPGLNRHTSGGGDKVSHKGWPRVTGIFWVVNDSGNHRRTGGPDN